MSDSRQGPSRADSADTGPESEPANPQSAAPIVPGPKSQSGPKNEAVFGSFTARDLAIFGGVLVTFIGSLLPLVQRGGGLNVWNGQGLFFIGIGILLPILLAGLFVWRRLAPEVSIRVGSLSLDQFASVVAVLTCSYFFLVTVTAFSPGGIVGFLGGAILVAATLFARAIPLFAGDFLGRAEVPAHVVARDAMPAAPKPAARQAAGQPAGGQPAPARVTPWAGSSAYDGGHAPHDDEAGVSAAAAAAAASGVAGAAAAGAGVAALAAGAMAAEGSSREPEGLEAEPKPEPHSASVADIVAAVHGEPEAGAGSPAVAAPGAADQAHTTALAAPGEVAPGEVGSGKTAPGETASEEAEPREETPGMAAPRETATEQAALRETAPAEAAPGEATREGTAPGEADGEAYGAPEPKLDANKTAAMPAAKAPATEEPPATQAAPVVDRSSGHEASRNYEESSADYEAFWFAVNQQRTAVDPQSGLPMFNLEPGQWILALQDRGSEFLVQSQDGRVGVLRELSGIERG